jgi:cation diffusion facilitator CzcD-associated flavoprotein CzcO
MPATAAAASPNAGAEVEHFDVLIVGAGVSGIGAACQLRRNCPDRRYLIVEGRNHLGGTWDLFRFPGIRSDSDLYTYGYEFKPWQGKPIATAEAIVAYLEEAIDEYDVGPNIRFGHHVTTAHWDSDAACWSVEMTRTETGEQSRLTCSFLWMCQGYYDYEQGYAPDFPGQDRFQGHLVHPQHWPEDLDHHGKRVVVIGSGATAVTLVPALAQDVEHVVMLQRRPSYVLSKENADDEFIAALRALEVPDAWLHEITRRHNLEQERLISTRSKTEPDVMAAELIEGVRALLPGGYDVERHFTPGYNPWAERLCIVPDADLFKAISAGNASVVTDQIETFTETGIRLASGQELEADIIVSATGLELQALGGIRFAVDGEPVEVAKRWTYKGMMLSDTPNLAWTFGYIRTSWTMRADMIAHFVCRVLNHLQAGGFSQCTPRLRREDADMTARGFIDLEDFSPGYMARAMHRFPRQGDRAPWTNPQNYYVERDTLAVGNLDDGVLEFRASGTHPEQQPRFLAAAGLRSAEAR